MTMLFNDKYCYKSKLTFRGVRMRSEQEVQETIMDWFSECENDEEIIEMESMISDLTAQERENRIYDLRN